MKSTLLSLNTQDFIKGLVVSVLSAILAIVLPAVNDGQLNFNWKQIGLTALTAGLSYLAKNLVTNSDDQLLKRDVLKVPKDR